MKPSSTTMVHHGDISSQFAPMCAENLSVSSIGSCDLDMGDAMLFVFTWAVALENPRHGFPNSEAITARVARAA